MKALKTVGTIFKHEILKGTGETIIGIDPGLQNLGIGIITINPESSINFVKKKKKIILQKQSIAQCINGYSYILLKIKQKRNIEEKLFFIYETLDVLFAEYSPQLVVVEDAFVGINKNSALKLGLVRGAILTAIGKHKIALETVAPKQIKMEVAGSGAAEKEEVQKSLKKMLKKWPKDVPLDSSDAVAAAFCGIKFLSTHVEIEE